MKNCPICAHKLKHITDGTIHTKYKTSNGEKDVLVKNLSYSKCDNCNEVFFDSQESENYEKQLEKALEQERINEHLLTAKEIKSIRKEYGLTQSQLENLLNIGAKNVAKWETYKSNQSKTIDTLLRKMRDDYCFFLKMLNNVDNKKFKNVIKTHKFYLDNISILELISKLYPDVNIRNISEDFILYVDKTVTDVLSAKVENHNSKLILREAI